MPQIFHRSTNLVSRVSIYGAVLIIGALGYALYTIAMSPWYTDQNMKRQQPIRLQVVEIDLHGFARQQVHRDGVGAERVHDQDAELLGRLLQLSSK